jgi:hypothetical protein
LPLEEARALVSELLEANAGCRLPCWWGFMPGQTSWREASQFYARLGSFISVQDYDQGALRYAYVQVPAPQTPVSRSWGGVDVLFHNFTIKEGIIASTDIFNFDIAPAYYMSNFLNAYGPPGEIWIRTFRIEEQSRPYLFDLFYPDLGILME